MVTVKKKQIPITQCKIDEELRLSYPLKPHLYGEWYTRLPDLPLIFLNAHDVIIFGIDSYQWCLDQGKEEVDVFVCDLGAKEALFLNFNLKSLFNDLNLYEKLLF